MHYDTEEAKLAIAERLERERAAAALIIGRYLLRGEPYPPEGASYHAHRITPGEVLGECVTTDEVEAILGALIHPGRDELLEWRSKAAEILATLGPDYLTDHEPALVARMAETMEKNSE